MKELRIIPFHQISEQDWTSFHQSCVDPVLFYQYPFLDSYVKTTQNNIDVLLYKERGRIIIALPGKFDKKKKTFYNLTYLGWDNLDFLIVSDTCKNTLKTFFAELYRVVDLVIYNNISDSSHQTIAQVSSDSIAFKKFRCPVVKLPHSYQDYLETLSVSFRRMINNRTNFCKKHGVEFRYLSNTNEPLEEAFLELNRLHEIRMEELDAESKFLKSDSQRFHQAIRGYKKKELILIVQAVEEEKVIGTLYGFVSSKRYAYFASGIDPNYSKYSLGIVLIGRVMDFLICNDYRYFDFLRGTEDYKYRWTKEDNQNYTVYSFFNNKGKFKAMKQYWHENKVRVGRKQTLVNLKRFF